MVNWLYFTYMFFIVIILTFFIGEEMSQFRIAEPHSQCMATQLQHNISGDTTLVLQKILESLGRIEPRQEYMINLLSPVETALVEKMPERAEIQAQGQLLREYKVLSTKTHCSVSRITGVGAHQAYSDAIAAFILNLKSTKDSIEKVMQSLFSDELVWLYNYDGKAGKKALNKLEIADITLAAFASMHDKKNLAARHFVSLSHNRYKHINGNIRN
ncbi:uncharacterized protein LOC125777382 [Bactrocera dorsalis]|uniref:Uncharacterized protein LOC125777382 n=1 Tax=Bactrocera dorsalis TaxID=27457 RepID=A0ABM3JFV7_BACDO|nr:uncharacterized protein LOC125777382 [Bactrocera dorsalis]